jgi:subtilisin-like proprotein convertase family protein
MVIAGTDTIQRSTVVKAVSSDFSDLQMLDPPMGANAISSRPTFSWQGSINADGYTLEVDESPAFASPYRKEVSSITATILDSALTENTLYYWRVRPANSCGLGDYSPIATFHTANLACQEFMGEDLPIALSQSAIVVGQSNIVIENPGLVQDVNVKSIQGFHESFGDLIFTVRAPSGKQVTLLDRQCGFSNRTFTVGFDDQALKPFSCQASFTNQVFIPMGSLDDFIGESAQGTWSLIVADSIIGSGGLIEGWSLELCGSLSPISPVIVTADTARAFFANSSVIDDQVLAVTDDEATAEELIFTIVTMTEKGVLQLQGDDLKVGGQFSQADLNEGRLTYLHEGLDSVPDAFSVTVIDGTGGWLAPITIPISISTEIVAVRDFKTLSGITVFPNPASDQLFVRNNSNPLERVIIAIVGMDGRLVFQTQTSIVQLMALDISKLTDGMYNLQVMGEQGVANLRFAKY